MPKFSRFIVLGLVAAAALMLAAPAFAWHASFPHSRNIVPLGESAQPNPVTSTGSQFNSDIAFWRNYAVEGSYDGFRVLDISNPSAPTEITEVKCGQSQGDITISPDGNILIRSQDSARVLPGNDPANACQEGGTAPAGTPGGTTQLGWEGLQIFDFSNKAAPRFIKAVFTDFGSHTHTQYYDKANNRLVIYVSRGGTRETHQGSGAYQPPPAPQNPYGGQNWPEDRGCITAVTVPLGNPTAAAVANRCITAGTAPAGVSAGGCHDVAVYEGIHRLFGACRPNMILWDISDPVNPRQLFEMEYPAINGWHSAAFSWNGKLLFAGWEPGGGSQASCLPTGQPTENQSARPYQTDAMKSIFVYRASDGALVGRWVLPREQTRTENCTIHNYAFVPFVDRHVLVQGSYQSGSSVVEFTSVGNEAWVGQEVAWVDPPPLSNTQLILGGAWSTHWYNGPIYESDIPRGVAIYGVTEPWWNNAVKQPYLNPQTMTERLTCRVTATGTLRAGRASTLRVNVRVKGQAIPGMNVRIRGVGINRALETNASGVASTSVKARRGGRLSISASELNVPACRTSKKVAAPRRAHHGGTAGAALTGRVR